MKTQFLRRFVRCSIHIDIQVRLSDLTNSEADAITNPKGERLDGEVIYYLVRFATA